jgi:hypothetical protein
MALHDELYKATLIDLSQANARVELSLYQQAVGYERMEEDVKVVEGVMYRVPVLRYYPPSATAGIWWTKSRMGWKGDSDGERPPGDGEEPFTPAAAGVQSESLRQTARRIAFVLHQGGKK